MVTHASTCQWAYDRFHGKRHKKLFLWIFRGFQRFFKNSWKPVYRTVDGLLPLMVGRENMWREIRIADRRKNGKFQIGLAGLGVAPIAQTFFYQRVSVCLIWSIKTEIGRFESEVCPLVRGLVRSVPAVGQFPIQAIEIFFCVILLVILGMRKITVFFWLLSYFSFSDRTSGSTFRIILVIVTVRFGWNHCGVCV